MCPVTSKNDNWISRDTNYSIKSNFRTHTSLLICKGQRKRKKGARQRRLVCFIPMVPRASRFACFQVYFSSLLFKCEGPVDEADFRLCWVEARCRSMEAGMLPPTNMAQARISELLSFIVNLWAYWSFSGTTFWVLTIPFCVESKTIAKKLRATNENRMHHDLPNYGSWVRFPLGGRNHFPIYLFNYVASKKTS